MLRSQFKDSAAGEAQEDTLIHIEAANPFNTITKAQAREATKRVAHILRDRYSIGTTGFGKDVVLAILYGGPLAPVIFYGIVAAGGIYSGASTESTVSELITQIKSAEACVLVCSPECQGQVLEAAAQCGLSDDKVLVADGSIPGQWTLNAKTQSRSQISILQATAPGLDWSPITDSNALANTTVCLLYSSGTTGLPKGVRISHRSLVASTVCTMEAAKQYQRSHSGFAFNTVAHLPMSNIAGIGLYSINPFYMGGTTYWMKKYNFESFIEYHRRYRPAYQFSVPPVWLQVSKSVNVTDHFDGLMVASTGSAPIGPDTIQDLRHKLGRGRTDIYQTWGTTETSGVITAQNWERFSQTGAWSVGELCPTTTLRVVDEDDRDVAEGEPGELLVGGPILAQGYFKRPDADQEAFGQPPGFYRTGDIGAYKEGLVYILDRKKELIKYKATQVAPAELEAVLTSHPAIVDAAVIGVWDKVRQTEVPRAYVVRRLTGESLSADKALVSANEVSEYVKSRLSTHKHLRGGVYFLESIPKSASGKILRKELRLKAQVNNMTPKL